MELKVYMWSSHRLYHEIGEDTLIKSVQKEDYRSEVRDLQSQGTNIFGGQDDGRGN